MSGQILTPEAAKHQSTEIIKSREALRKSMEAAIVEMTPRVEAFLSDILDDAGKVVQLEKLVVESVEGLSIRLEPSNAPIDPTPRMQSGLHEIGAEYGYTIHVGLSYLPE